MTNEELAQDLISWIRRTVSAAGSEGVVLGMSGGIDSSVVAVLCRYAFPDTCLGISMPCHSADLDRAHAELVAARFQIPIKIIPLDEVFNSLTKVLTIDKYNTGEGKTALANIKPRLRMLTLYYNANRLNYVVVGSGNRSELAVGYFTKYGDGGVDIMPIGNLVKSQVRDLAAYLEIPQEIIDKPPSAGLWDGQTDETEMGFTYNELDGYLTMGTTGEEAKQKIDLLMAKSGHKRCLPPIPLCQ
jgi:NAD+ synthase